MGPVPECEWLRKFKIKLSNKGDSNQNVTPEYNIAWLGHFENVVDG